MFDPFKGIAGVAGELQGLVSMDPIAKITDFVCDAAGLDQKTAGVVKIGVAAATGNIATAIGGVGDLSAGLAYDTEATTEYHRASAVGEQAQSCQGYSSKPPAGEPSSDVGAAVSDLFQALSNPALLKVISPGYWLLSELLEGDGNKGPGGVGGGRTPSGDPVNPSSPLASDYGEYRDALQILKANYETFDTAVGLNDNYLTLENFKAIMNNPNAAPELRQAAKFFLDHPEYFNRLEMSVGSAKKDGIIGMPDVDREIAIVNADIKRHGLRSAAKTGGSPESGRVGSDDGKVGGGQRPDESETRAPVGGESELAKILNSNMSMEAKIMALLQHILDRLDDQIENTMKDLVAAEDKKFEASQRKDDGKDKAAHNAKKDADRLQRELQTLMEKRKQMAELMSSMSNKFHEMTKTAIQNLGRA